MFDITNYKLNNVDVGTCLISRDYFNEVYDYTKTSYKRNVLWVWGYVNANFTANNTVEIYQEPQMVTPCITCGIVPAPWKDFRLSYGGSSIGAHARVLDQQGRMYFWGEVFAHAFAGNCTASGFASFRRPSTSNSTYNHEISFGGGIVRLGQDHTHAGVSIITEGGIGQSLTGRVWGENCGGLLGDCTTIFRCNTASWCSSNREVADISITDSVNSCMYTGHAISSGFFYYWGKSTGGPVNRSIPVLSPQFGASQLPSVKKFCTSGFTVGVTLSSCVTPTCTDSPENLLMMSGYNDKGQLGDSTTINKFYASNNWVCTNPPLAVKSFSVGRCSSFAVASNGTMWAWGDNSFGQLGNNRTVGVSCPVQNIDKNNDWRYVTTNRDGTSVAALKMDGSLWVWGDVRYVQGSSYLTSSSRSSPVQVTTKKNWVRVGIERNEPSTQYIVGITEEDL